MRTVAQRDVVHRLTRPLPCNHCFGAMGCEKFHATIQRWGPTYTFCSRDCLDGFKRANNVQYYLTTWESGADG